MRRGRERVRAEGRASSRDGGGRGLGFAFGRLRGMRDDAARRANQGRARPDRRDSIEAMPRRSGAIEERTGALRAIASRELTPQNSLKHKDFPLNPADLKFERKNG